MFQVMFQVKLFSYRGGGGNVTRRRMNRCSALDTQAGDPLCDCIVPPRDFTTLGVSACSYGRLPIAMPAPTMRGDGFAFCAAAAPLLMPH